MISTAVFILIFARPSIRILTTFRCPLFEASIREVEPRLDPIYERLEYKEEGRNETRVCKFRSDLASTKTPTIRACPK